MAAVLAIADADVPERSGLADRRRRGRRSLRASRCALRLAYERTHGVRYPAAGLHPSAEGNVHGGASDAEREPDPLLRRQSRKSDPGSLRAAPQDAAPEPEADRWGE